MTRTLLVLLAAAPACVTVYQPVSSLQRPATVDPSAPNFAGKRMLVRCIPSGEGADQGESGDLCQNMSTLYTNQGAKVDIEIPNDDGIGVDRGESGDEPAAKHDMIIELRARRLHNENSPMLWILCYASLTLIPAITEATFAQDVVIRDSEGFLLVADTLQARFIRYFGLGYWAVNGLLDLIVRPKGQELVGNNHRNDFSRDFHGQMSQLAFHAMMRAKVLKSFEPDAPEVAPAPAKAKPGKAPVRPPGQPAGPPRKQGAPPPGVSQPPAPGVPL